jgi:hypothetical protein
MSDAAARARSLPWLASAARLVGATTLAALVAFSGDAHAEPSTADRARARELGEDGLSLYDRGEYASALVKLNQAEAIVEAPTIGLYVARCLKELGRLVEAESRYRDVIDRPLDRSPPRLFRDAQETARREHAQLQPRIPMLEIEVRGATPEMIRVDGRPITLRAGEAVAVRVDPGRHRVEARSGNASAVEDVVVDERERRRIALVFSSRSPADSASPAPPPSEAAPPAAQSDASSGSPQRVAGWVALGVGGAGLAVWGITGGIALSRSSALECEGDTCQAGGSDVDGLNTLRTVSAVGFWTGLACAGTGTVLLLTASSKTGTPASRGSAPARVSLHLAPSSASLRGAW